MDLASVSAQNLKITFGPMILCLSKLMTAEKLKYDEMTKNRDKLADEVANLSKQLSDLKSSQSTANPSSNLPKPNEPRSPIPPSGNSKGDTITQPGKK